MYKLITFEGIDGSGKTTVIAKVKEKLENNGLKVLTLREPGTTKVGESLRRLINSKTPRHITTDLYLFTAARNDMLNSVIAPAIKLYDVILIDRFIDSTVAYQHYGLGIDRDTVDQLNRLVTKSIKIHKTIFLDVDVKTSVERRHKRKVLDRYEETDFLRKVYAGYKEIIKENPDRFAVIKNKELNKTVQKVIDIILQTDSVERKQLETNNGEVMTLRATVVRPGRTPKQEPTILLSSVKKRNGRTVLTDHLWSRYTRPFVEAGTLIPGDVIEFTGQVEAYTKSHRGEILTDYGITNITNVSVVKQAKMPKSEDDEWQRSDLAYITSVMTPELYEEMVSRYVGFTMAMIHKYINTKGGS